jgi:hypothetical protein
MRGGFAGKSKKENQFDGLSVDGRVILKSILKGWDSVTGLM